MKKMFFMAAVLAVMTSCSDNDYFGDSPNEALANGQALTDEINFGFSVPQLTKGNIYGSAAAELLGNHFYVTGTKGTEGANNPSGTLVFDNYLVAYTTNTAGTTASNTANWEYVGIVPDGSTYDKLSNLNSQTIKYWDYSEPQYDFLAFSTGNHKAKKTTTPSTGEIGVTRMNYGSALASSGVAYTFYLPDANAISQAYISDIKKVEVGDYGKEVQLKFKNLGSKVRIALYETVPGYSVKDVQFYTVDADAMDFTGDKQDEAALIFTEGGALTLKGSINVIFPQVGTNNNGKEAKNVAMATVTPGSDPADKTTKKSFGNLKYVADEADEKVQGTYYLGRSLPTASYAGDEYKNYYQSVFPVSTQAPITLRVDYTLVPIDGADETITVKGAKAVVPSTYTKWQPNYAYTYIFKISDNTNGWTGTVNKPGLFPITFDAVVTEATDATAEQATITTVATPTITTYQQNHNTESNEYSKSVAKNIYVQVMDNKTATATLKNDLNDNTKDVTPRSLLYKVTTETTTPISEANVMDALENQSSVDAGNITGRNGLLLTKATIDATVTSIVNGPDDNPITVSAGQAAEIASTIAAGDYAYVYDYTAADKNKVFTTIYQPISVTENSPIGTAGQTFKSVATTALDGVSSVTIENETPSQTYIYFSKTKNGTSSWTYSFVSVDGKTKLPAGLIKYEVASLGEAQGTDNAVAGTFYFTNYVRNDGAYAVKVIKVVE